MVSISRVLVKPVQQRSQSRLMETTITPEGDGLVQLELTVTLRCRPLQSLQGLDLSLAELVVPLPGLFTGRAAAATVVLLTSTFLMKAEPGFPGQQGEQTTALLSIPGDLLSRSHPTSATGQAIVEADLPAVARLLQSGQDKLHVWLADRMSRWVLQLHLRAARQKAHQTLTPVHEVQADRAAIRNSRGLPPPTPHSQHPQHHLLADHAEYS